MLSFVLLSMEAFLSCAAASQDPKMIPPEVIESWATVPGWYSHMGMPEAVQTEAEFRHVGTVGAVPTSFVDWQGDMGRMGSGSQLARYWPHDHGQRCDRRRGSHSSTCSTRPRHPHHQPTNHVTATETETKTRVCRFGSHQTITVTHEGCRPDRSERDNHHHKPCSQGSHSVVTVTSSGAGMIMPPSTTTASTAPAPAPAPAPATTVSNSALRRTSGGMVKLVLLSLAAILMAF